MKIIVGLGNPGPEYETTRHNIGFLAIDHMLDQWKSFENQRMQSKFQSELASGQTPSKIKCVLVKPQTFMNLSGHSVGDIVRFFKSAVSDVIVVHDDIDLPFGNIRIKQGGGHGGHNGLKSLDSNLGDVTYVRVRVGVGRAEHASVSAHVLGPFSNTELKELESLLPKISDAIDLIAQDKLIQAQNQYNA